MPHGAPLSRERGFALLIVLWGLVLLAFLVSQITLSGRTEIKIANNLDAAAVAEMAADGSIYQTLFHLLAADQQHWAAPSTHRVLIEDTVVQVSIVNLAGRVNPNTATPELLSELLIALGIDAPDASALGVAIVAWRTPDEKAAGLPGVPFADLDELGAVRGMTLALLAALKPHLTLWWENDPDPAFADPVVLKALRALGSGISRSSDVERPMQAVSIVASAVGSRGGRFVRRAEATVNSAAPRRRWRLLAWDRQDE